MEVTFKVNKKQYTMDIEPKESLLSILRERLDLTGVKNGCDQGHCGACTVVMNGKAVKSCLIRGKKIDGADILTVEGLSAGGNLHPIQEAFIEATAVQCGFCTPGYIMELYALFNNNPNASLEEIKSALEGHLCRCTGYKPIFEAALLAQKKIQNSQ
ncbi:MAG: (2Fe-2S)-binding protein [Candidatus Hodarchaeales archaeon]